MLILKDATATDADGVKEGNIVIEKDEIKSIGEREEVDSTRDTTVIDVDGYVAPGLVDAHIHLMLDGRADPTTLNHDSEATFAYRATRHLRDALEAGVTTVRDLGSTNSLNIDAAKAVEEGVVEGPDVVACGENIVMTGGHGHWFGREADGRAEVRKAVREQLKKGADVVKCMATGGVLTEGAVTGAPELSLEELEVLVETAESKDVPTAAHAHGAKGIKNAVEAGISSVEHGTYMDADAAEMMAEKGTYWVPTAKALHGIVENADQGIPDWAVEKAKDAADAFEEAFEHALDEGVEIAMGTDAGTPFNYHSDIPEEIELMAEYGVPPEEGLEAATVNSADLLGIDDIGKVKEGYKANLVVLEDNPLEDVAAWQEPEHVIKGGEVLKTR